MCCVARPSPVPRFGYSSKTIGSGLPFSRFFGTSFEECTPNLHLHLIKNASKRLGHAIGSWNCLRRGQYFEYSNGTEMKMRKTIGAILLLIGIAGVATASVPEIDPSSGVNALALLSGALILIRGRRKK